LYKFEDLTGQTFGERVVVGLSHQHPISKNYYWNVVCSCGKEGVVCGSKLKQSKACARCSGKINGRKGLDSQAKDAPCYFIKCGDFVKVGSSRNPARRFKDMQSHNPYPLELLFVDNLHDEKYWHDKLQSCHHRGEWYHYGGACEIVDLT